MKPYDASKYMKHKNAMGMPRDDIKSLDSSSGDPMTDFVMNFKGNTSNDNDFEVGDFVEVDNEECCCNGSKGRIIRTNDEGIHIVIIEPNDVKQIGDIVIKSADDLNLIEKY